MIEGQHPAFQLGPFAIGVPVATTWLIIALQAGLALLARSRPAAETGHASLFATVVEGTVESMHDAIEAMAPGHGARLLPFLGTLWLFLAVANLIGLVPGLDSPTADLSVTAALALVVFFAVHWFGIRDGGLRAYLRHYVKPTPVLLPFHLIAEVSRTVALAVRLFGNIMSLELTALILLLVAGFLLPIPVLMLHIIEALVQAYIFGVLALVYIAAGLQTRPDTTPNTVPGAAP